MIPSEDQPIAPLRLIDAVVAALAALVLTASTAMICLNVFYRYAVLGWLRGLAESAAWAEMLYRPLDTWLGAISVTADEVPGLLLVWIAFLGAYLAMRRGGHISFDLVVEKIPDPLRRVSRTVIDAALILFLALVIIQSIRMIEIDGATEIETASIAQGWFMAILPLSAGLLILALAQRVHARWRGGA